MPAVITSLTNPTVKSLLRLHDRATRDGTRTFLIEGRTEVERAIAADLSFESLYLCEKLFGKAPSEILAGPLPRTHLAEAPFRRVSRRQHPDGVLAVARQFPTGLDRIRLSNPPLVLVVEGIEKPGNLGGILRTALAAGVDGLIVADPGTDVFNPNVIRASLGAVFLLPIAVTNAETARDWLLGHSLAILVAAPQAAKPVWEADLRTGLALVVGAEHAGLSQVWTGIGLPVAIPMSVAHRPGVDSLNASVAAGVLLFEAVRQRVTRPSENTEWGR